MPPLKYILKVCLLGDGAVGKTSLVRRFVFDAFDDRYLQSFGTKVSKKVVSFENVEANLMIWDILGQRTQKTLHAAYYRGAAGALAVCDFTRPETLQSLSSWVDGFLSVVGEAPIIVLTNKSDLDKAFSIGDARAFGESIGSPVIETSAKTGDNVEETFAQITRMMVAEDSK
ncbi:MAG: GTP-binding protein [Methanobacteriota archaeon]|nr:MAG: GTP-binding protein [Euryarchaeota archaeon]